jgi:hypothetical protein
MSAEILLHSTQSCDGKSWSKGRKHSTSPHDVQVEHPQNVGMSRFQAKQNLTLMACLQKYVVEDIASCRWKQFILVFYYLLGCLHKWQHGTLIMGYFFCSGGVARKAKKIRGKSKS